jgi:hypothetical protein
MLKNMVLMKIVRFETEVFRSSFLEVLFNPQQHETPMNKESTLLLNELLLRVNKIEVNQALHSHLIQGLQAISVPQPKISKNKKAKRTKQINVSTQVLALLMKYPDDKIWTSDELAEKIGCTGAAVRKTPAWKCCQKQKAGAKEQCSIRKGFRNQNGNINAVTKDKKIDD